MNHGAGLAIFGTNSEAVSLSVDERLHLTDHLLEKGGSEEGVFTYYSEIIERVGRDKLGIYLYHIPQMTQMTQVPLTMSLIERLIKRYPHTIMGAKDSSGDWANSRAMIEAFAPIGFAVFPASESLLTASLALGGAGCISATVSVNPSGIKALFDRWNMPDGMMLQEQADQIRKIFQATPKIAAMKRTAAEHSGHADWARVRPPLCGLDEEAAASLRRALGAVGFGMEGYPR